MSGDSSRRNFSTISIRARTELMFQDAILRVEDMRAALAGWGFAVDAETSAPSAGKIKAPAPGAWSEGQPSVVYARLDYGSEAGQQGENPTATPAIARYVLVSRSCRGDEWA